ncbi:hypothetical protein Tco_0095997, partial [Tanacetum coccineum]
GKPSYSRFTKTNDFKGVPPPLSGDYTPTPQEEIDDSFEGSCGNTSEHSFEIESESLSKPNEMSKSRLEVTNEKDVSAPKSKEVEPNCDYYDKKIAREAEVKRVVNTVQLNASRPKLNSVRPNINTGRTNINSVRPKVNAVSPKVKTVRSKQPVTHKTFNSSSPKRP